MSGLNPDLQRLVVAEQLASRPSDADRARLFAALQTRLGTAAGGAQSASVAQSSSQALAAKMASVAAATLAIVAGGFFLVRSLTGEPTTVVSPAKEATPIAAHSTLAAAEMVPPPTPAPPAVTSAPVESKPSPLSGAARGATRAHDSLSEEVAILSRAQAELHGGRAENALRLLAEHERKHKRGILAEERTAAKVQALCALGRVSEANALLGRLSPQSLSGDSARQACSSSKKGSPSR